MESRLLSRVNAALLVAAVAGSVAAAPKKPAANKPAARSDAVSAAGKKLFTSSGCVGCHKLAGVVPGGTSGPNLSRVGKDRDATWIANKLKNPKSTNPKSIMPAFAGSAQNLKTLAAFLASLR